MVVGKILHVHEYDVSNYTQKIRAAAANGSRVRVRLGERDR